MFLNFFKKKKISAEKNDQSTKVKRPLKQATKPKPTRIGELGEYKINIQLDQLPSDAKYLSDLLIPNSKSKSGYSQIDHVILTPYALFVIETKNYSGTIYGDRKRAKWSVNGKFPMMNPFNQNYGHIQAIQAILPNVEARKFISIVSFTKRCTFKVNEELRKIQSNDLIVYDIELSEWINRKLSVLKLQHISPAYSDETILQMFNKLTSTNITNELIREHHVTILKKQNRGTS